MTDSGFNSQQHSPVSPTHCRCGQSFADGLALDVHILGPELAHRINRDRSEAMVLIHAKADEMASEGGEVR